MNDPLVSVIVPAYQAAAWISDCIESVIRQSYSNWELIIIDDGSTDNTKKICLGYTMIDSRIKYFYQKNSKQGKARNLGIFKSQGDFLAFLDADDVWLPGKLENSLDIINAHKCDIVVTGAKVWDGTENWQNSPNKHVEASEYFGQVGFYKFALGNRVVMSTALIRKEVLESIGGFDEDLKISSAEDYDLWLRCIKAGKLILSVDECMTLYRLHATSATYSDNLATIAASRVVLKNVSSKDLPHNQWVRVRRKWIGRLLERLRVGEDPVIIKGLLSSFFSYKVLFNCLWMLRKLLEYSVFKKLLVRFAMSRF